MACTNKGKLIRILDTSYCLYYRHIIGKGSYSVVYGGIDMKNNEKIAIKKISIKNMDDDTKKLIDAEIIMVNMLVKTSHRNIVRYIDVIMMSDVIYIVMEYCEQGILANILIGPMRENIIKYYFKQLINGIIFLHSNGYVHRDIKPENIMLTDNYRTIKIGDFGFCEKNKITENDFYCGTLIYMAPEMIFAQKYDKRIDIWSAGMVLYEMFYGYHPFKGMDMDALKTMMGSANYQLKFKYSDNTAINDESIDVLRRILTYMEDRIQGIDIIDCEWLCVENNGLPEEITPINLFYSKGDKKLSQSLHIESNLPQIIKVRDNQMISKSQITNGRQDGQISQLFTGEFRDVIDRWHRPRWPHKQDDSYDR